MSVFKARELWDAPLAQDDSDRRLGLPGLETTDIEVYCSRGCMCLVRTAEKPGTDIIITGTWSGSLRGFCPEQVPYSTDQLIFEKAFDGPILQVESGNFILGSSSAGSFQLALLHTDKVTICYFSANKTPEESPSVAILRAYKLKASAYSMVTGEFGGVKGRQMLCVALLDGRFTLIDQETVIETPVLEDFLFPGPMCYVASRDSFAIASSCWTADCYSYSEMASKAGLIASKPDQLAKMRKSWTYNCGECLVDIQSPPTDDKNTILALGERHLFWLDVNGAMRSIRKLDSSPSFLSLYPSAKEGCLNMIMGTTTQTLFVFEDMIPKWTSQLPFAVVDVQVARIASAEGVLVALAEDGHVSAYYLGTDPVVYETKATAATRKFNEEEVKLETGRLAELIKQQEAGSGDAAPVAIEAPQIAVNVGAFSEITFTFDPRSYGSQRLPASKCQISMAPQGLAAMDVQIDVQVPEPISVVFTHTFIEALDRKMTVGMTVQNTLQSSPQGLSGTLVVRFTQKGVNRVHKSIFSLPISLIAQSAPLAKKAHVKLDFDISPHPVKLTELFPDFASQDESQGLTFDFYGTGLATILISKKQEAKIRIQSDDPSLLAVVCQEFQRRISFVAPECSVVCASNFPSAEFEAIINEKSTLQKLYQTLTKDLELWTSQLFAVEKRFLARLKDRDITIVNKLEELLEETQERIVEVVDQCETTQRSLENVKVRMSAMVNLMHWLVTLNNKTLTADEAATLKQIVDGALEDTSDESWEARSSQSAKYYTFQRLSQGNTSSSVLYQTDFSDPINLLKRAYLNQLDIGQTKKKDTHALTSPGTAV